MTNNLKDQVTDNEVATAKQDANTPTEELSPGTPPSIDSSELDSVSGGASTRPKYLANNDELVRRSHMTRAELAQTDAAWAKTFASLSPERKEAIRKQAALNAAHLKTHTDED
jgi:hypothetical protein